MRRLATFGLLTVTLSACDSIAPSPPVSGPATQAMPATTFDLGPVPALTWTEVELPNAEGGTLGRVIVAPDGFLIFGGIADRSLTWWSADGASWVAAILPSNGADHLPWVGTSTATATVLVGSGTAVQCAHPFGEVLWRRERGEPAFSVVPFDANLFCAGGSFSIAAFEERFVVAGRGTGEQPFAWLSDDGQHWVDGSNGLSFDAPPEILALTNAGFMEIGYGPITDVRLLGPDGWTRIAPPPVQSAAEGMQPVILVSTAAGPLAIFQSSDGDRASAWLRDANGAWSQASLAGIPGGFLQAGTSVRGVPYLHVFDGAQAHLYASADLTNWVEVQTPGLSEIGSLAVVGNRVVIVGNKGPYEMGLGDPGVFIADLPPK